MVICNGSYSFIFCSASYSIHLFYFMWCGIRLCLVHVNLTVIGRFQRQQTGHSMSKTSITTNINTQLISNFYWFLDNFWLILCTEESAEEDAESIQLTSESTIDSTSTTNSSVMNTTIISSGASTTRIRTGSLIVSMDMTTAIKSLQV
jgi:hypothetical protein